MGGRHGWLRGSELGWRAQGCTLVLCCGCGWRGRAADAIRLAGEKEGRRTAERHMELWVMQATRCMGVDKAGAAAHAPAMRVLLPPGSKLHSGHAPLDTSCASRQSPFHLWRAAAADLQCQRYPVQEEREQGRALRQQQQPQPRLLGPLLEPSDHGRNAGSGGKLQVV